MQDNQNSVDEAHRKAIIGSVESSFWLYDSQAGFDLTHPVSPTSPTVPNAVRMQTTKVPITIDPVKSALIIVDMQNFFLSTALGRQPQSKGLQAQQKLMSYAIPAARKAGIRIVWLNWGLTEEDIRTMPSAACRAFGFETVAASSFESYAEARFSQQGMILDTTVSGNEPTRLETMGKSPRIYRGIGEHIGPAVLNDGSKIEAGRQLMRDQWNTSLTPELLVAYEQGLKVEPPDMLVHKNRFSGLWGASTACTEFLDNHGIRTLLFAGINTDQCVGSSMQDAYSKGYDCILLSDGSATSSPSSCQEAYEYNAAESYGFCTSCEDLWNGVEAQFN